MTDTPSLRTYGPAAPTLHSLRGIRFIEGEGGGAPAGGTSAPQTGASGGDSSTAGNEPTGGGTAPQTGAEGKVEDLPDWAQRIIRDTRKEAGDYRTKAKANEDGLAQLRDAAAVALGLKQAEQVTAEQLTQQLTAAQAQAKQNAIQLAAFRAANAQGVNADALLDSASFLRAADALDHTSADFSAQLSAAVTAALTANPTLRSTTRAVGASGPDDTGGTGENGLITEAQLAAASKDNPEQVARWLAEGKLVHLL